MRCCPGDRRIRMKKTIPVIFGLIAIVVAVYALFKISPKIEFAIDLFIMSFGILALIWAYKAYQALATNSSLKAYSLLFALALTFIVINKILLISISLFSLPGLYSYLSHATIIVGYILFVIASYKILIIGEEFGFADSAKMIKEALRENKQKKRR